MKILYAIQATGNGHLSRAHAILPILMKYGEVDILLSGTQADIPILYPVKYRLKGLSFTFGKNGGIDLWNSYSEASVLRLKQEYESLPVENYNLIINDFEPISAWAAQLKGVPCIALSHQAALLEPSVPLANETDPVGKFVLRNYAPAHQKIGFHFKSYSQNILTPIIRPEIRNLKTSNKGHITVYLPAWNATELVSKFSTIKSIQWHIFSKHCNAASTIENITVYPVNQELFIHSMSQSAGVLCGAGFETPAETIFLGKKLMVMPMKNQYEQLCNATALKEMGISVIKNLKEKHLEKIKTWIDTDAIIQIHYPDIIQLAVERVFESYQKIIETEEHKSNLFSNSWKKLKIA